MPPLSSRARAMPLSGIREMMDLAAAMPGVLRLEIGEPDFQTPRPITEAAFGWALANRVGYPPNSGITPLREAIAHKVTTLNGLPCATANVNVTVGATGALSLALMASVEPGDEVLVPDPGWAGYPAMVALAGGALKPYGLTAENGFKPTVEAVERALSPRTRAVIVNSPSNPTGAVADPDELAALVRLAERRGFWLIADECYDEVVFDAPHRCAGTFCALEDGPVLSAFSFSKTYAMTGWRVGYLVAPAPVSVSVTRMQAASVASASVVAQIGALSALEGPQDSVAEMVGAYIRRRDLAVDLLSSAGVDHVRPGGALYVFVDIRSSGMTSRDFAMDLLREHAVCTTPGSAFGANSEGFLRVSLAASDADLREGLGRMLALLAARSR